MEKSHLKLGNEYFNKGAVFFNSKEYEKSIVEFEKAIAEYKQVKASDSIITLLVKAYTHIGLCFYKQRRFTLAIQNYTKGLTQELTGYTSIDKNNRLRLYNSRGAAYWKSKQYDAALNDFDTCIKIDPNFELAYINRGNLKKERGQFKEAITDYNCALALNPGNPLTYTNRGNVYRELKDYSKAILDYDKAICLAPKYISAHLNKAKTYYSKGEIDNAIQVLNKVVDDVDPNCAEAYALRGFLYLDKDNDKALKDYCDVIKITEKNGDPSNLKFYIVTAYLYIKKDDSTKAIKALDQGRCNLLHILYFNIFPLLDDIKDANVKAKKEAIRKEVLYPFVVKDPLFKKAMTKIKKEEEVNADSYKEIYLLSLELMVTLHVKNNLTNKSNRKPFEPTVAHYTTKKTAGKLLFKETTKEGAKEVSPMRLSSVATANDPEEGLTLLRCLGIGKQSDFENSNYEQSDFGAFITCLTFNHESLNQFRLYGKENNKEATGVSLVIRKDYFETNLDKCIVSTELDFTNKNVSDSSLGLDTISPLDESDESEKLPLFRCVYMDPRTGKIVSVGHREHYTFYRENKPREDKDVKAYAKEITKIAKKFTEKFKKLQKEIDILNTELKKKQDKEKLSSEDRKKEQDEQDAIIAELLLNLRYLVKHVAFKEEQECRIIRVANFEDENIIVEANARMFINYLPISLSDLHRVYFAPSTGGHKLFQDQMKKEGFRCRCQISDSPFRKEAE